MRTLLINNILMRFPISPLFCHDITSWYSQINHYCGLNNNFVVAFFSAFSQFFWLSFALHLHLRRERFWRHPRYPRQSRQCRRRSWRPVAAKWSPGTTTRSPRLRSSRLRSQRQLQSPMPRRPWQLTALMPLHLLRTPIPHLFYCNPLQTELDFTWIRISSHDMSSFCNNTAFNKSNFGIWLFIVFLYSQSNIYSFDLRFISFWKDFPSFRYDQLKFSLIVRNFIYSLWYW